MDSIDDILFEKMILELMPDHAKLTIQRILKELRVNPHLQSQHGLLEMGFLFHSENKDEALKAIGAFLAGVSFAFNWAKHPGIMNESCIEFLKICAKRRGENVVNFLERKAEKI